MQSLTIVSIENQLSRRPDPVTIATELVPRLHQALELAKTPAETNDVRTMFAMVNKYLLRQLPNVARTRQEYYEKMTPAERGYVEASAKAGKLWAALPNKAKAGGDRMSDHRNGRDNGRSALEEGFSSRTDAQRCTHVGALPPEDLRTYFTEAASDGKHITLNGAEAVWKNLQADDGLEIDESILIPDNNNVVEPGQVWRLGRHRLVCGNAYQARERRLLIGETAVDALISDPPYGIGYKPDWEKWNGSPSDFKAVVGDDEPFDPTPFLDYTTVALFGANYFSDRLPIGSWACWDKRLGEEADEMFGSPFELAWYRSENTQRRAFMIRVLHGGVINADSENGNNEKRYVATQKPVKVMAALIEQLTKRGDVILDPFCGSGSTLLACEQLDRTCLAMDIHPEAVGITLMRWGNLTGETPCLE